MNLVIVQARLGSSRFPRKILSSLNGITILEFLIYRITQSKSVDMCVIATSTNKIDDELVEFCEDRNIKTFRGSEDDCLDRHYKCAKLFNPTSISKIPSDVPFIDPNLIDEVIELFNMGTYDFVSTLHPPTFPDGLDVETFSFEVLETAWENADKDYEREHTTPYIWDNTNKFKIGSITSGHKKNYFMNYRWTIDYRKDLEFMQVVYKNFIADNPNFYWHELVDFLDNNSSIAAINQKYNGVNWYGKYINVLKNFDKNMTKHND